ncbi:uncharacterized protein (DUF2336 family) [Zavarzinia compransoris]|nr:uncharacterized protein (DUF2336 family) [Zavarzinia compransoris]
MQPPQVYRNWTEVTVSEAETNGAIPGGTTLTREDLETLMADPSPERQAGAAAKVAAAWRSGTLDPHAQASAEALFRVIARKAAVAVRAALSEAVKDADALPHDIAIKLASDVDHVALPVLEASNVLTDEDLVALVVEASPAGLAAMAGRPTVSAPLAEALIDRGDEGAVARLVGNPGAALSDDNLDHVVDHHGASPRVAEPLAGRSGLPARVAARLMAMVAEQLRQHLAGRRAMSPDLLADLILQSRERATLMLPHGVGQDLESFIIDLHRQGQLTPTLIMRSLLTGDYLFFETALALRAGVPVGNAAALISDPGGSGLARLFTVAGMPEVQLPLARVALIAAEETELRDEPGAREHYRELVIERILTGFGDRVDTESVDYMITKIGRSPAPAGSASGQAAR